jgi:hypothetical protein
VVIKEEPAMDTKKINEVLLKFYEEKSWDNFLPVLREMEGVLYKKAMYFRRYFRGIEEVEDTISRLQLHLYELVETYNPSKGCEIFRFVNYRLGLYLEKSSNEMQKNRHLIGMSECEDFVDVVSLRGVFEKIEKDLSAESKKVLREFYKSMDKNRHTWDNIMARIRREARRTKPCFIDTRKRNSFINRFYRFMEEVKRLAEEKNLKIA